VGVLKKESGGNNITEKKSSSLQDDPIMIYSPSQTESPILAHSMSWTVKRCVFRNDVEIAELWSKVKILFWIFSVIFFIFVSILFYNHIVLPMLIFVCFCIKEIWFMCNFLLLQIWVIYLENIEINYWQIEIKIIHIHNLIWIIWWCRM
jgi:hypothetical protein